MARAFAWNRRSGTAFSPTLMASPKRSPSSRKKVASQQRLADIIRKDELRKAGVLDASVDLRQQSIASALADFEASLNAAHRAAKHDRTPILYIHRTADR